MKNLAQDLRYGIRMLLRNPGFTAIAVLSLALGIGANISIFSVLNAALWQPLPFKDPDRLMSVVFEMEKPIEPGGSTAMPVWSYPKFEVLRDHNEVFEQVAAVSQQSFPLTGTEAPERLEVEMVSASYFPLLGIEAATGRTFLAEEDRTPTTHPVALIGHGLWERRYGSDPNVIGQTISLNKVPLTIVGILPEGFKGQAGTAEVWVPMMMAPALTFPRRLASPHAHWADVIGRLKPGLTPAQARAGLHSVAESVAQTYPAPGLSFTTVEPVPLREVKVEPAIRAALAVLFVAVGLVVLIACVNIANLLTSRAVSRRKEMAIRLALGATRGRIIRQLLTESILLALIGGVAGLLLSPWGVEFLMALKPVNARPTPADTTQIFNLIPVRLNGAVLAFNFLLSLATGLLFGLLPAIQASRPDLNESLKESPGAVFDGVRSLRRFSLRRLLVVTEIALALVLLAGAGLMIKSFARLQAVQIGFDPENLLTLRVHLPKYSEEAARAFYEQLLTRVAALPGVQSASVSSSVPLSGLSKTIMAIKDRPQASEGAPVIVGVHSVGPDHFKTLRTPLLRGRMFTDQDRDKSTRVAIIGEAAARKFWPDEDPIGKQIHLGIGWDKNDFAEVVGIVGNVKYGKVEQMAEPDVYISYLQPNGEGASYILARTTGDPAALAPALRREILAMDKNVPAYDIRTMAERAADATSRTRFSALLLGIFSALALALSAIGIYGVIAYAVSRRTREIGIRMALGARAGDVLRMVMAEAAFLTLAGLAVGLAAAFAATRILASQLYQVGVTDPVTFITISLLLVGVALAASYVPARRAAKIDPGIALRYE